MNDRTETYEALREWEMLLKSPAWKRLCVIADEQLQGRRNEILLTPLSDANAVYEQEFKKGEVSGIALFVQIPQTCVETLRQDLEHLPVDLSDEE